MKRDTMTSRPLRGLPRLDSEKPADGKATSLSATQELKPPTAADVLEVFQLFQDNLLERIDKRDETFLKLVQKTTSDTLAEYARLAEQSHDHSVRLDKAESAIEELKKKINELSSEVTTLKLKSGRAST